MRKLVSKSLLVPGILVAVAPDGQSIAFATTTRLYVMRSDGSELVVVFEKEAFRSVDWVP